jgi:hypothetical protein
MTDDDTLVKREAQEIGEAWSQRCDRNDRRSLVEQDAFL